MIPVINTTTSVLGYNQFEAFQYQPYATGNPTSWACPNLPPGLSINTDTGLISGAATTAGVFVCGITATNADGTSDPLVLTIGIDAASAVLTNSGYQLQIDVTTREVTVVVSASAASSSPPASVTPLPADLPAGTAQLFARKNDHLLLWISFIKNGVTIDLNLADLKLSLKELDSGSPFALASTFYKFGSGIGTYFGLFADLSAATDLSGILSDYYLDSGTVFNALAEIAWQEENGETGVFGPASWNFSTRTFLVAVEDDMTS